MPEVTKLFLGASSMLLNGTLVARAGTALVCMLAHQHGVPALVCCETYKFAERVLLDSICYNELGDPDELIPESERAGGTPGDPGSAPGGASGGAPKGSGSESSGGGSGATAGAPATRGASAADWRDLPRLKLLNLMYDATPMKYLTMVVPVERRVSNMQRMVTPSYKIEPKWV